MKYLIVGVMAVAGTLTAQVRTEKDLQKDLTSKLTELQRLNRGTAERSSQLTETLLGVAESDHPPSRATVVVLARYLTDALSTRSLPAPVVNDLATSLVGVFRSAGMSTSDYRELLTRFERALSSAGVTVRAGQTLSSKLTEVGKEVRGPQDTPLLVR